jgi:hypothetical protein
LLGQGDRSTRGVDNIGIAMANDPAKVCSPTPDRERNALLLILYRDVAPCGLMQAKPKDIAEFVNQQVLSHLKKRGAVPKELHPPRIMLP